MKTSKIRVTGLCAGNSPGPVNSPHKGPVTRKMFPFDDVIMILDVPHNVDVQVKTNEMNLAQVFFGHVFKDLLQSAVICSQDTVKQMFISRDIRL